MAIKITCGKPRMALDIPAYFPNFVQLNNGDLLLQSMWGDDRRPNQEEYDIFYAFNGPTTEQDWIDFNARLKKETDYKFSHILASDWARSTDGGKTWAQTGLPPFVSYVQLDNGDVIGMQWYSYHDAEGGTIVRSWRSHDNCRTWDAPYDIPVQGQPVLEGGLLNTRRRIIHLEGDTYLILVYGSFGKNDLRRSMVYRTTDCFRTMHFYSNIAVWRPDMESKAGMTETDMVRTADGRLLAVIRNESLCPMYQAFSDDDGATWTPAELGPGAGVNPGLWKLDNDVLVCSYGRPGVMAAFSENNGKSWIKRTTLLMAQNEVDGTTGAVGGNPWNKQRSCCYTDVIQTAPNVATICYSAPADWQDDPTKTPWNAQDRLDFRTYCVDIAVERD